MTDLAALRSLRRAACAAAQRLAARVRGSVCSAAAALLLAALPWGAPAQAAPDGVLVYAAASLTDVLQTIAAQGGFHDVQFSFAASSTLARQIEQGAPAHLFISADADWMDTAIKTGRIDAATRRDWTGGQLALIAPGPLPTGATVPQTADAVTKLVRDALAQPDARIATGDPAHVPVGKYAQAGLTSLGLWNQVAPRLARADNVRSALVLVERGEVPLGITYRTDAQPPAKVHVVALFPPGSHPPIVYPAALLKDAGPAAQRFFAYLFSPPAQAALSAAGFAAPAR